MGGSAPYILSFHYIGKMDLYEKVLASTGRVNRPMKGMKMLGKYNKPVNNKLGFYNMPIQSRLGVYQ